MTVLFARVTWKSFYRVFLVAAMLSACCAAVEARPYRICVVKSREFVQYDTALRGFSRTLRNKGIHASVDILNMRGSRDAGVRIMKDIARSAPDLILTIGTPATELAREFFPSTPVVFCMVLNPVADGLAESLVSSGCNLTGACLDIPADIQFKTLKTMLPSARKIGVVYSPRNSAPLITEASEAARGLDCELIALPVSGASDLPRAMDELRMRRIDCLWSVSDGTVFNSFTSIQFIILYSLQNRIPFMGLSPSFVKSGALIALSCDPEDNGCQAGERAAAVLAGASPAETPIAIPRKTMISYNARIAEQLGVIIPPAISDNAEEVFQ